MSAYVHACPQPSAWLTVFRLNQQSWHLDTKKWPLQNSQLFNAFHIFGFKIWTFLSATYQFILPIPGQRGPGKDAPFSPWQYQLWSQVPDFHKTSYQFYVTECPRALSYTIQRVQHHGLISFPATLGIISKQIHLRLILNNNVKKNMADVPKFAVELGVSAAGQYLDHEHSGCSDHQCRCIYVQYTH